MNHRLLFVISSSFLFLACSPAKYIGRSARTTVLNDAALQTAHVGISIYEPAKGKYWYNYQGDKYFVPASNTKLPTCYAAMKYLGDSLVAGRVSVSEKNDLLLFPSGDPSFLNGEFSYQPLFAQMKMFKRIYLYGDSWKEKRWGSGWAWSDYDASYMAERSIFPMYGNVARFYLAGDTFHVIPKGIPVDIAASLGYDADNGTVITKNFGVKRSLDDNEFSLYSSNTPFSTESIPLRTDVGIICGLLEDTLHVEVVPAEIADGYNLNLPQRIIHSQPTDSLLKPMMHRSDNFFAEQSLLMVSNELLGVMNDAKIIDTLLKTDFKDLPQRPRWVDGSGLSRYNLFTPQDFVFILNKMRSDFGMERIQNILPTGNKGTLGGRFVNDSSYIFAKTGSLSGVISLSGFLYTKKNKLLIFSVLVNNHNAVPSQVRGAVERFISGVRNKY